MNGNGAGDFQLLPEAQINSVSVRMGIIYHDPVMGNNIIIM
jgi:hypothetical protein